MMLLTLVPLLLAATPQEYARSANTDPAVQVWLDREAAYDRGDRARLYVRARADGYLVVLHSDPTGTIRVLFPLDPVDDDFVRGGEVYEIRGRADREAFLVEERTGSGVVLAAWSPDPFHFGAFVRGDHWDYRTIAARDVRDAEASLVDVVHRMATTHGFDYDVVSYLVGPAASPATRVVSSIGAHVGLCAGCYGPRVWHRSSFSLSVSFGSFGYYPWVHRPVFFDPYFHPFHYDPFFFRLHRRSIWVYDPFFFHVPRRAIWVYDPFWIRAPRHHRTGVGVHIRYAGGSCWGDPFCHRDRNLRSRPGLATGIVVSSLTGGTLSERSAVQRIARPAPSDGASGRMGRASGQSNAPERIGNRSTERTAQERSGIRSTDRSATERLGIRSTERSATERLGIRSTERSTTERIGIRSTDRSATERSGIRSTDRSATERLGIRSTDRSATERIGIRSTDRNPTERIGRTERAVTQRITGTTSGRLRSTASSEDSRRATTPPSRSASPSITRPQTPVRSSPPPERSTRSLRSVPQERPTSSPRAERSTSSVRPRSTATTVRPERSATAVRSERSTSSVRSERSTPSARSGRSTSSVRSAPATATSTRGAARGEARGSAARGASGRIGGNR